MVISKAESMGCSAAQVKGVAITGGLLEPEDFEMESLLLGTCIGLEAVSDRD